MTKTKKITYYVLLVLVSAIFLLAAVSKLTGNAEAEAGFTVAHLPIWFMYFVGVCELLGVIGLWMRKFQMAAAGGLSIILLGAIIVTAIFVSVPEAVFPLIALIFLGIVAKIGTKRRMTTMAAPIA